MPQRYVPREIHTANMPLAGVKFAVNERVYPPFITLAQQIGAESPGLPQHLAEALGAREASAPAWTCWDRELIEKVSQDSHIPATMIDSMETSGHSWLDDLLTGIAGSVDEMAVFHRVRDAVQTLAQKGRVILIGHGSAYFTRDLPGGVHVRLVAPMPLRVRNVAARFNLTPEKAARHIRHIDHQRQDFFAGFGIRQPLSPDMFTAVLNSGSLDQESLSRAILAMLPEGHL